MAVRFEPNTPHRSLTDQKDLRKLRVEPQGHCHIRASRLEPASARGLPQEFRTEKFRGEYASYFPVKIALILSRQGSDAPQSMRENRSDFLSSPTAHPRRGLCNKSMSKADLAREHYLQPHHRE